MVTGLQAQLYDAELQKAAYLTQIAADFVVNVQQSGEAHAWAQSGDHVVWSGSQLTRSPDGLLYYDADPNRHIEILQPGNVPPDARTDQSLADTAVLDQLFPTLLAQAETAVGIYLQGPQLTFRNWQSSPTFVPNRIFCWMPGKRCTAWPRRRCTTAPNTPAPLALKWRCAAWINKSG